MVRAKRSEHGMSGHRLNKIWRMMRQRCNNPNDQAYKNYGGKGIKVCREWSKFEPFMQWSLSNGYAEGLTLDRIDSSKHYSPENCRWLTRSENTKKAQEGRQSGKGRQKVYVEFKGKKQTHKQWADNIGITTVALRSRLSSPYWTLEEALTLKAGEQPVGARKVETITYNNQTKSLSEWAGIIGVSPETLRARLNVSKWSIEKALTTKARAKRK